MKKKLIASSWAAQLFAYLVDNDDSRMDDIDMINERAELAAAEFERVRLEGGDANMASEAAHRKLMEGIEDEIKD